MLVSAKEMLEKAKAGHYAVGQFNINNLEWTKSILLTAEELKSPVILGVSEGAGKYMTGYKTAAVMLDGYLKAKRDELPEPMQRFIYIGIREIIKNISPGFKKQKEEELKVIISTESDWIRFQSVQEERKNEF